MPCSASPRPTARLKPTVMVIDLDRFKQVNDSVGMAVGDSILLTLARRLSRVIKRAGHAGAAVRRPVRADPVVGERRRKDHRGRAKPSAVPCARRSPSTNARFSLTGSIGLTLGDTEPQRGEEVLKDAELAMYHAKRGGGDRIEVFKPAMRARKTDRLSLGIRSAPRARARRDHHPVPADRAARRPRARRLRGAGALEPSEARPPVARRIHHHRRRDRADRRARPVRAGARRPPAERLAAHACGSAIRCSSASTSRRGNCCATT